MDSDWVAGLPFEQKSRILRRCGYSEQDISAMDSDQQATALQQAIHWGIYAGSLPPAPVEKGSALTFLDAESGKPITLSEVAKRGHARIIREPEISVHSFKKALGLFQKDRSLDPVDREHLKRLAADSRVEGHWDFIRRRCKARVTWAASPGWFIWHMLVARRAAVLIGDYPERQRQAENADKLAAFLRNSGETDELTCQLVEGLARQLREPEEFQPFDSTPIPLSRKGRNTSRGQATHHTRELKAFMSWMREYLKATYGQPLNEIVATLTDVAFPGQETTVDQVRSAVKPTTRRGRSRR